jgi:ribose-phosphate pyrophosphokinase
VISIILWLLAFTIHSAELAPESGKYGNDNSFVKLYPGSNCEKVAGREVFMKLPKTLDYNSLMELLITVRAVENFGASQIKIESDILLKNISITGELSEYLSLEELLEIAGANFVKEEKVIRPLIKNLVYKNQVINPNSYIGSSNHLQLLDELSEILQKAPLSFADIYDHQDKIMGQKIYWLSASIAPVNDHFFETLAEIRFMAERGAVVHLISPYLPYARSDKPEFDIGAIASGRLIADLIEGVGTSSTTVVRAHAPQSLGFFKIHAHEISARKTIIDFLKSVEVEHIISPDAGFQKDATKYQHELAKAHGSYVGLSVMNKERNSHGQEKILGGTNLDQIKDKNVAIIDDETATGGTLHGVAEIVAQFQPKSITAVVTHLAGPADKSLNSEFIDRMVVTNTLPFKVLKPKLTVLSIAQEIAESIKFEDENIKRGPVQVSIGSRSSL